MLAVPGRLDTLTGGYLYDNRVVAALNERGRAAELLSLPAGFPDPDAATLDEAFARLAAVPGGATLVVDGLAYGVLSPDRIAALKRPVVALVHHPLALETGIPESRVAALEASERAALAAASMVVATSATTAATLEQRFGVARENILVARPGVDRAARAGGSRGGEVVILTVGAVVARKNHIAMVHALARLDAPGWRWRIVGDMTRDPDCAALLRAAVDASGLGDRVEFLGGIGRKELERAYASADIFALPSRYEGYGMAYAEALAHGLPVVAGDGGAGREVVPEAAGAVVSPDDVLGLAGALGRLIADPAARRAASDAAWEAAARLPGWSDAAAAFERLLAPEMQR